MANQFSDDIVWQSGELATVDLFTSMTGNDNFINNVYLENSLLNVNPDTGNTRDHHKHIVNNAVIYARQLTVQPNADLNIDSDGYAYFTKTVSFPDNFFHDGYMPSVILTMHKNRALAQSVLTVSQSPQSVTFRVYVFDHASNVTNNREFVVEMLVIGVKPVEDTVVDNNVDPSDSATTGGDPTPTPGSIMILDYLSGGGDGGVRAINNNNQACGLSNKADFVHYPVRWNGTTATELDTVPTSTVSTRGVAYDINDSGDVCGVVFDTSISDYFAVRWDGAGTSYTTLGSIANVSTTTAYSINSAGECFGTGTWTASSPNSRVAIKWDTSGNGTIIAPASPTDTDFADGYGCNNIGDFCGDIPRGGGGHDPVYFPSGGGVTALQPYTVSTDASDLSDNLDVVGNSNNFPNRRALFWPAAGNYQVLPLLGVGQETFAEKIDPTGTFICGAAIDDTSLVHAVKWATGNVIALDFLPGGSDAWGYGVNNAGWVGGYSDDGVQYYPVIWT